MKTRWVKIEQEVPDLSVYVSKGAALLDEQYPGWARKVKRKQLDMQSGYSCVLGQMGLQAGFDGVDDDGPFTVMSRKLFGDDEGAVSEYGFDMIDEVVQWLGDHQTWLSDVETAQRWVWDELNELWKEEIRERTKKKIKVTV